MIAMQTLAPHAEEVAGTLKAALSGEDLFCLTLHYMDLLLEQDDARSIEAKQLARQTCLQVKLRLRDERGWGEEELAAAAALVALTVRDCIRCYDYDKWYYDVMCDELLEGVREVAPSMCEPLRTALSSQFCQESMIGLMRQWFEAYAVGPDYLSDDVDELLDEVARHDEPRPDIEHRAEIVDQLLPYFEGDARRAEAFLVAIYRHSDEEVAAEVLRLRRARLIDVDRKLKQLHQTLQEFGLYTASYANLTVMTRL